MSDISEEYMAWKHSTATGPEPTASERDWVAREYHMRVIRALVAERDGARASVARLADAVRDYLCGAGTQEDLEHVVWSTQHRSKGNHE